VNHLVTYKRRCSESGNYGTGVTQEGTDDEAVIFGADQDEAFVEHWLI